MNLKPLLQTNKLLKTLHARMAPIATISDFSHATHTESEERFDINIGCMDPEDDLDDELGYTAFERWNYRRIIYSPDNQEKTWISIGESFYRASKHLVEGVANGSLFEDIEGRTAIFLFRHYLEVTLKKIIVAGRCLTTDGFLSQDEVKAIKRGHDLSDLWRKVLDDAKPKMPLHAPWETYDYEFAASCIAEFHSADTNGFAFRYSGQGGERAHIDFAQLLIAMDHVYQVLEGILTVLIEIRSEIQDWLDEQASW